MPLIDPVLLPPDYDTGVYSRQVSHDGTDPHARGYRRSWRGLVFVYRTGALQPFASRLERDAASVLQARPATVALERASRSVEYRDGARWRRYTPDWVVFVDDDPAPFVVEVKPSERAAELQGMLSAVRHAVHRTGAPFVVMTEQEIYQRNRFANSTALCAAGRLQGLDGRDVIRMRAFVRSRASTSVLDLVADGWKRASARDLLMHLAAWGDCTFDMSRPFHDRTPLATRERPR